MPAIKIAAVQCPSIAGDIERNIDLHLQMVRSALQHGVELIVFPELSLTGYEMVFAERCKLSLNDSRLASFRKLAVQHRITIVVGAPLDNGEGLPALGAIIFSPAGVSAYHKQHLYGLENEFFQPGLPSRPIKVKELLVGLAICADTNHPEHAAAAAAAHAHIYAAGLMITPEGLEKDRGQMQSYALQHGMTTLFANHCVPTGGLVSAGKSAIWGPDGALLCEAEGTEACLVIAQQRALDWHGELYPVVLKDNKNSSQAYA